MGREKKGVFSFRLERAHGETSLQSSETDVDVRWGHGLWIPKRAIVKYQSKHLCKKKGKADTLNISLYLSLS